MRELDLSEQAAISGGVGMVLWDPERPPGSPCPEGPSPPDGPPGTEDAIPPDGAPPGGDTQLPDHWFDDMANSPTQIPINPDDYIPGVPQDPNWSPSDVVTPGSIYCPPMV